MTPTILFGLAALCAFYVGHFAERARNAHQLYSSYRARVRSNLAHWIKDTMMTLMVSIGLAALVIAALMH